MEYKVIKKLMYNQAKEVELKFLEPGDIIAVNNCGDFDLKADMILIDFKVEHSKERNTITYNFLQPSGKSGVWCENFYKNEPIYTVIGKATLKQITEENAPIL